MYILNKCTKTLIFDLCIDRLFKFVYYFTNIIPEEVSYFIKNYNRRNIAICNLLIPRSVAKDTFGYSVLHIIKPTVTLDDRLNIVITGQPYHKIIEHDNKPILAKQNKITLKIHKDNIIVKSHSEIISTIALIKPIQLDL